MSIVSNIFSIQLKLKAISLALGKLNYFASASEPTFYNKLQEFT